MSYAKSATATYTTEQEARDAGTSDVRIWLDKIQAQLDDETEKQWREEARIAIAVFEATRKVTGLSGYSGRPTFNIFHSNIETLVPAIYNSPPIPDVRRKFGDWDKIARFGAQIAERSIDATIDGDDFDGVMKDAVRAACVPGRGVSRVRYQPYTGQMTSDVDGSQYEAIVHEDATAENVGWDRIVIGPARDWKQVPWIAFAHDLTKDEVARLMHPGEAPDPDPSHPPEMAQKIANDHKAKLEEFRARLERLPFGGPGKDSDEVEQKPMKGVLKTIPVWEVWDKLTRKVLFVSDKDIALPLAVIDDPLGLNGFFPIPKPIQQTRRVSSLTPMCPHNVYADLVEEIEETTRRIKATIEDMRVRGLGDPKLAGDLEQLRDARDSEIVSASMAEMFGPGGAPDLSKLVLWWPVEQDVKVLQQLMQHRESLKQIIYEVTGISDILRGASVASETATAQQIKATWGSQRVQEMQQEAARYARDLLRLLAEIIFNKFQDQTIRQMTLLPEPADEEEIGAQVEAQVQQSMQPGPNGEPPQQPDPGQLQALHQQMMEQANQQAEEDFQKALQVLRSQLRFFCVDVETDSTIRGNLAADQQQISNFLGMTGQFLQAATGAAQVAPQILPHLLEMWARLSVKSFKLGKGADDILDKLVDAARQAATQGMGQGQGDPQAAQEADAQRQHEQGMLAEQSAEAQRARDHDLTMAQTNDEMSDRAHARAMQAFQAKIAGALPPVGGMPAQGGFPQ